MNLKSLILLQTCLLLTVTTIAMARRGHHKVKYFDLSHPLSNDMPNNPGVKHFNLTKDKNSRINNGTMWLASYSFCSGEHVGTHIDAPLHFNEKGWSLDQIPWDHLINVPLTVVNVQPQLDTMDNPSAYRITPDTFMNHEKEYGRIKSKSVVLVYTGWSKYWPDQSLYYGMADLTNLTSTIFPSFSPEGVKWLWTKRKAIAIGLDTPSIDPDKGIDLSYNFPTHVYTTGHQMYALENVANLEQLVDRNHQNFKVFVLPLKITGGSGAPVRILVQEKL